MKKKSATKRAALAPHVDMQRGYALDYAKAKPNRFAARLSKDAIAIVLDSDVAPLDPKTKKLA